MNKILSNCHSIADLRRVAKRRLPRAVFDYMDGAAEDEVTLYHNQADFGRYELVPRFLVDVKNVDLSTTVLGSTYRCAIRVGAYGHVQVVSPYRRTGGCQSGAKSRHNLFPLIGSYQVHRRYCRINDGPKMLQLYVWRDRGILKEFINRAKASNYSALCLTVDLPRAGQRERDLRNGFTVPPQVRLSNILDTLMRPSWLWGFLTSPRMSLENVREHTTAAENLFSVIDYTTAQLIRR